MYVRLEFVNNILCHNSWIIFIEEIWNSHARENLVTEFSVLLPKSVGFVFMKFCFSDFSPAFVLMKKILLHEA